ncbi:YaaL family protein [Paenibacillus cisolokensis]|jgi:Protein of unknown function (DUF2508).|uniref:DUF2508 domain-containing protein n=1 Tax=Paenibacillus cisolokensis TaxID=1658519 RepID=A0ABQ4NAH8_9BACL|nr:MULTISPECIES: YaaL family protein [Paenibacillus]ALS25644.1 hypothetical protein IJ21_02000 [Paenibacillus sp. 32O-W]GIQ64954.1 hypothetical protein PACILC2_35220 [Paenibacillus cisolokensis]
MRRWWRKVRERETAGQRAMEEAVFGSRLLGEIEEAHRDWENANRHFEYAVGKDQIDYAIYAMEAAEKRYEMLLRQAKQFAVTHPVWRKGTAG